MSKPRNAPKQRTNWIITEVLETFPQKDWNLNRWYKIVNGSTKFALLKESNLASSYVGNENIFIRVATSLKCGNFRIESIAWLLVRTKSSRKLVHVFHSNIVPSIESGIKNSIIDISQK